MAVDKNVNVTLTATDKVSPVVKKMTAVLGKDLTSSIQSVGMAFIAVNQTIELTTRIFGQFSNAVSSVITAANAQEDAVNRMNTSLQNIGEFSEAASKDMQDFASSMQLVTKFGDEVILSQAAFAQALGAGAEQSKEVVTAAADMAAALNIDLNAAVRNLSKTLGGLPGELGEVLPELKALTVEQLRAGEGVTLLAKKYAGFAQKEVQTFSGSVDQAKNAMGDMLEQMGFLITQSDVAIAGIQEFASIMKSLEAQIKSVGVFLSENKETIVALAKTIATLTAATGAYLLASKARLAIEKLLFVTSTDLFGATKKNRLETIQAEAAVKAKSIIDKTSAIIQKALSAARNRDTIVMKANMVVSKAQTIALNAQMMAGIALSKAKQLLTLSTLKNTAITIKNTVIQAASAVQARVVAVAQAALATVQNFFTLATLKNTLATISATVAQGVRATAMGVLTATVTAATIAQNIFNAAILANPIGLIAVGAIAAGAALFALFKNIDLVTGALKVGLGLAIQMVSSELSMLIKGLAVLVGVFNSDWANSLRKAADGLDSYAKSLEASGRAQMALGKGIKTTTSMTTAQSQALKKLTIEYNKTAAAAESAINAAKEFSPQIELTAFKKEQEAFTSSLEALKAKSEELKIKLTASADLPAIKAQLDLVIAKQAETELAITALKIREARFIRNVRLKEVTIELESQRQKVFSVESEIKQMRLQAANDTRIQLVEISKQRFLEQMGLATAAAQSGITIAQEASIAANDVALSAFRARLDAEKSMALSVEEQKILEITTLRASLLQGTDAGSAAGEDVEVIKEKEKMAQLQALRDAGLVTEVQFQSDKSSLIMAGKQRAFELELAMEEQRAAALGLSPDALQLQLDIQAERDAAELERLTFKLNSQQLTEEQFRVAKEQGEIASTERVAKLKESFLNKELKRAQQQGSFLDRLRIQSELNQIQGAGKVAQAKAFFQSQEVSTAATALGNLATLTQSGSKDMFEIGKKAAMAAAVINSAQGFTKALAENGPILGPILGATILAAGAVQLGTIKNQKFGGGGAGGSNLAAPKAPIVSATGGQFDNGIDAVPKSLSGKSFILDGGERVVKTEQNKDLTEFLNNPESSGNTFNINIGTVDSDERVQQVADAVMEQLREKSERGEPVISAKGVA